MHIPDVNECQNVGNFLSCDGIQEGVKYFTAKDKLRLTSWGVICVVKIMAVRSAGVEPLRRP